MSFTKLDSHKLANAFGGGAAAIILIMFAVTKFLIAPVLLILAVNVLFKTSIDPFFWYHWLAACILLALVHKSSSSSS